MTIPETYYTIRRIAPNLIEMARFGSEWFSTEAGRDGVEPRNVFDIKDQPKGLQCTCQGWRWQKDRSKHMHTIIARHWKESLNETPGVCYWWENEDLEFNRFIYPELFENV